MESIAINSELTAMPNLDCIRKPSIRAAETDDNIAQALGAKVHNPAHFDASGVYIQAAHVAESLQWSSS